MQKIENVQQREVWKVVIDFPDRQDKKRVGLSLAARGQAQVKYYLRKKAVPPKWLKRLGYGLFAEESRGAAEFIFNTVSADDVFYTGFEIRLLRCYAGPPMRICALGYEVALARGEFEPRCEFYGTTYRWLIPVEVERSVICVGRVYNLREEK